MRKRAIFLMIISIQLSVILLTLFDNISPLRQLLSFIYLTFIPGYILMRIIGIKGFQSSEGLLYNIGLSLFFTMFLGCFINMGLPLIGVDKPITNLNIIGAYSLSILILLLFLYVKDRDSKLWMGFEKGKQLNSYSPSIILLLINLPLLSILGSFLVNYYGINIVLLFLLIEIALVASLIALNIIPSKYYALAISMIALSLLWHTSLISSYFTGWDINIEYYLQKTVLNSGYWDYKQSSDVGSMLSVVILAPVYTIFTGLSAVWIFKIIYPIYYSLVPLGLYRLYSKVFNNEKMAFWGTFLFISFYVFFRDLTGLARQQIAEFFFMLILLVIMERNINPFRKSILLLCFSFSIIVAHYGLSYFLLIILVSSYLLVYIYKLLWKDKIETINLNYILFFVITCLSWYMFMNSSHLFSELVIIGNKIFISLRDLFFNVASRDDEIMLAIGMKGPEYTSIQRIIYLYLQYFINLIIIIGFSRALINAKRKHINLNYIMLSIASCLFFIFLVVLPLASSIFGSGRVFHLVLFLLAPMCFLGIATILGYIKKTNVKNLLTQVFLVLIFIPYFLFNSGFIFEVTGDRPTSISISKKINQPLFSTAEIISKDWVGDYLSNKENIKIYSDVYSKLLLTGEMGLQSKGLSIDNINEAKSNFIYLRKFNIDSGQFYVYDPKLASRRFDYLVIDHSLLKNKDKIYDNIDAQLYK